MKKRKKKKEKRKKSNKKKLDSTYAWISFILALFFWVPLINVVLILPASIFFGIKAMRKAKKEPKKYGGFALAFFSAMWASLSFILSIVMLILILQGKI